MEQNGNNNEAGEPVSYTYTPQLSVNTVTGADAYVTETQYDVAGRVDLRKLGGTAATPSLLQDYAYYLWTDKVNNLGQGGGLKELKASVPGASKPLEYFSYQYDAAGNIATLYDASSNQATTQTQTFGYDALNRLVGAQATGGSYGAYPWETYGYDPATGNLTQKAGMALGYDAQSAGCPGGALSRPHAATTAGTNSYCYDADGNQIRRTVAASHDTPPANLSLVVESQGTPGNGFTYRVFDAVSTYTIQPNDVLEFDVYMDSSNPTFQGGFDAMLSGSSTVRDTSGWVDQNGLSIHPGVNLPSAGGQWYHRVFQISNKAGQALSNFKIVHQGSAAGTYVILLDNIKITNGGAIKKVIYSDGFPLSNLQAEGPTGEILYQNLSTAQASSSVYHYDAENHLTGVVGAATASFAYDGDGSRVKGTVNGVTTYYVSPSFEVEQPDSLSLSVESRSTASNGYAYRVFDNTTTYVIQAGDQLEFDEYLDKDNPVVNGGFDAELSSSGAVRGSGWVDQNGICIHPGCDVLAARDQWYHRVFAIGSGANSKVGQTLRNFKIAMEGDLAGYYVIRLDNIKITNGGVVKKVIYSDGFPQTDQPAAEGATGEIVYQSLLRSTSYYQAGSQRVALRRAGYADSNGLKWLLTDHLGSTTVVTNASGSDPNPSHTLYKPWGETRYASGGQMTTYKFTGQREESDLGIYYYGARWYDSYLNPVHPTG